MLLFCFGYATATFARSRTKAREAKGEAKGEAKEAKEANVVLIFSFASLAFRPLVLRIGQQG
jgi:hypothetical protein